MTAPPKWMKKGEPGYVVVAGWAEHSHNLLRVDVHDSKGAFSHGDRMPVDSRTGGPRGYVLEGSPRVPKRKKTHTWGTPVRVDGEKWGHRCGQCKLERMDVCAGSYFLYRRNSEQWVQSQRTPPCEVK